MEKKPEKNRRDLTLAVQSRVNDELKVGYCFFKGNGKSEGAVTPYEKEIESLRKLLTEVETNEDSDFDNEDNGPEDILEENFSNHESYSDHDTESEADGDSGNEKVNNLEWFLSKDGV
ncbi:hypothetical protein AVEN_117569-1 [Araneus ventricosus]|uniref:Uncharacterized protein n=1 Tax=Araneus ventricosus TaxID=182803 RepID=A0A4Y2IUS2_ARAVE|nr:hypothetical protein AVEN_117569-1 [Araneus ventricosus]